jgi:hypothetical protein
MGFTAGIVDKTTIKLAVGSTKIFFMFSPHPKHLAYSAHAVPFIFPCERFP